MPILCITRRDAKLPGVVNATISCKPNEDQPHDKHARAPSDAKPWFQYFDASRHPISTAGVKRAVKET